MFSVLHVEWQFLDVDLRLQMDAGPAGGTRELPIQCLHAARPSNAGLALRMATGMMLFSKLCYVPRAHDFVAVPLLLM